MVPILAVALQGLYISEIIQKVFLLKGSSIYCYERFKCKANGAQKPSPIRSTMQLNRGINKEKCPKGALAQLVERLVRNEKVRGSTPLSSTTARFG